MENTLKPECAGVWNHLGKVFGKIAPPPQTVSCTKALMCASVWTVRSRAKPRPVILKAMRKSLHKTSIDHPKKKKQWRIRKAGIQEFVQSCLGQFFFFWFIKKKIRGIKKFVQGCLGQILFFFFDLWKKNRGIKEFVRGGLGGWALITTTDTSKGPQKNRRLELAKPPIFSIYAS